MQLTKEKSITAEEMFRELGYEKMDEDEKRIIYTKGTEIVLEFNFSTEWTFSAYIQTFDPDGKVKEVCNLSFDEIKAISKQFEELESDSGTTI